MDLVTIASYATPEEAHLARLRLCREDIPAYVIGETLVQLFWTWTLLLGGVRLQVREDDVESACTILVAEPVFPAHKNGGLACSHCGAECAQPYLAARRWAALGLSPFALLTLMRAILIPWHRWQCSQCGRTCK